MDLNCFLINPLCQALTFLIANLLLVLLTGGSNADRVYTISGVLYTVFIIANTILLFWAAAPWTYFLWSIGATLGVMYGFYLSADSYLKYIAKNDDSGESSMIFLVVMYHPPALLLVIFLKWLF